MMAIPSGQQSLFDPPQDEALASEGSPAAAWEQDAATRALDELFDQTFQYRTGKAYHELMRFIARFRFYSPFNAMLVHVQMPGAVFVAPPHRWLRDYGRRIRSGARPLVVLQPMGPVMFVFDVSDTEVTKDARPLPPEVEKPFEVREGHVGSELGTAIDNAKRDGLRVTLSAGGSQSAGSIQTVPKDVTVSQKFQTGVDKQRKPIFVDVPVRYDLVINAKASPEAQYATMVHELAHLYCGHLGTPSNRWWPDRRGLRKNVEEFEAESVTHLVCSRLGVNTPSEQYLAGYVDSAEKVPPISLECVMKAAGLIETMSRQRMEARKPIEDKEVKRRATSLLKVFQAYQASNGVLNGWIDCEAIEAGFERAWQERDYDTITEMACRIPENVLQNSPKLLTWCDQAVARAGGNP